MAESSDPSDAATEPDPSVGAAPEASTAPPEAEAERVGALPAPAPVPTAIGFDTNVRMTLLFLSVVTLVGVGAWGTSQLFCNYNPVYSQEFTPVELERRVERPKDAGLEFHHRLFVQDYDVAAELALERGIDIVHERQGACDETCRAERTARKQRASTRASLHRVRGVEAWVTAETFFDGLVVEETYLLRRVERRWLVVGRESPPE